MQRDLPLRYRPDPERASPGIEIPRRTGGTDKRFLHDVRYRGRIVAHQPADISPDGGDIVELNLAHDAIAAVETPDTDA